MADMSGSTEGRVSIWGVADMESFGLEVLCLILRLILRKDGNPAHQRTELGVARFAN